MPEAPSLEVARRAVASAPPALSTAESVFEAILARIVDGDPEAGERLPAERELARRLGASRPTVREALKRLAAWNLVEPRRGSGVVVRPRREWSIEVLPTFLRRELVVAGESGAEAGVLVADLLALRRTVVLEIVRLVGGRATPEGLEASREAVARAWAARHDPGAFAHADLGLIRSVVEAADFMPAVWLLNQLSTVYLDLVGSLASALEPPESYLDDHHRFLDALASGDTDSAIDRLGRYLEHHDTVLVTRLGMVLETR